MCVDYVGVLSGVVSCFMCGFEAFFLPLLCDQRPSRVPGGGLGFSSGLAGALAGVSLLRKRSRNSKSKCAFQ